VESLLFVSGGVLELAVELAVVAEVAVRPPITLAEVAVLVGHPEGPVSQHSKFLGFNLMSHTQ
jgi:hypothetical protein